MKLDETNLKCRLLSMFRKGRILTASSTLASEFVLGQTGCRSDLAIWNGSFVGVEIKSARDSLSRLPDQITAYRRFFDTVVVLCDEVHQSKVQQICDLDIGIYVWKDGKQIEIVRPAGRNLKIDRSAYAKAITLRQLQTALKLKSSSRTPRLELERRVLNDLSIDLRQVFTTNFEDTYRATSSSFWQAIGGKRISELHLPLLSRFAPGREDIQRLQTARRDFWMDWSRQAEAMFGRDQSDHPVSSPVPALSEPLSAWT